MSLPAALQQATQFIQKLKANAGSAEGLLKEIPRVFFFRADLGTLMLWGDTADEYGDCLRSLSEAVAPSEQFSLKAVEDVFQTTILKALDIPEEHSETPFDQRLTGAVEELRQVLQAKPNLWQIHFRVLGLAPNGLPITVGRVEFYLADKTRLSTMSDTVNTIIDRSTSALEQKQSAKEHILQRLTEHLEGQVAACVEVEAVDQVAARSLALQELRLTLDVVNFYSDILHPRGARAYAYLPGERERVSDVSISFQEGAKPNVFLNETIRGPLTPLSWASMDAEKAQAYGFMQITEILARPHKNGLEERVLSAFQWAGRATVDERQEEAFLLYAIALESLLLGSNITIELGYRLRLRCAHLLGLNPESRQKIAKQIADLYKARSKIVHSGSVQITDADISTIRFYTKNALVALLTEKHFIAMKNEQELDQWFENKLMGG